MAKDVKEWSNLTVAFEISKRTQDWGELVVATGPLQGQSVLHLGGWPEAGERLRAPLVRRVVRFFVPRGLRRVRLSVGWARGREGEEQAGEGGVEEKLAFQSLWFPVFLSTPSHVVGFSSHS